MLVELSAKQWEQSVSRAKDSDLFDELVFINCISRVYACKALYYVVKNEEQACILLQVYTDAANRIILPTHFFYTACHIIRLEEKDMPCVRESLQELIKKHRKISLKLPPRIRDIGVFRETGFVVKSYQTMLKDLNSEDYSANIKRLIKKSYKENVLLKQNSDIEIAFHLNAEMMRTYGTSKAETLRIQEVLNELMKVEKAVCFTAYQSDTLLGASFLINDSKRSYLMSINSLSEYARMGVQARIYYEFFQYFRDKGLLYCDLMGGNIPGVAAFKAKFAAKPLGYYIVEYDRFYVLNSFVRNMKQRIKKLMRVFFNK